MINSEQIILIYLAFLSVAIVDVVAIASISSLLGVRIKAVGLFWFSGLFDFKLKGIDVHLGVFPFPSSSVQFAESYPQPTDNPEDIDYTKRVFPELSALTKLIIVLSGVVSNVAIASIFIGFSAIESTLKGISQVGQFLMSRELGLNCLEQISLLQHNQGNLITWATLTTKVVAINLLPLPVFYGGFVIITIFESLTQRRVSPQQLASITLMMLIMVLSLFILNWGGFILELISGVR